MKFLKKFENFDMDQSTEAGEEDLLNKKSDCYPFCDEEEEEDEESSGIPDADDQITLEKKKVQKKEEKEDKKEDKKIPTKGLTAAQKKLPAGLQKAIMARKSKSK